jgi:hypothetical protein
MQDKNKKSFGIKILLRNPLLCAILIIEDVSTKTLERRQCKKA